MSLLIFFLCCYGITMVIVQSKFMRPVRNLLGVIKFFKSLLHCMMCTGFWVSLAATYFTKYSIATIYLSQTGWLALVLSAFGLMTLIVLGYLIQMAIINYFKIDW